MNEQLAAIVNCILGAFGEATEVGGESLSAFWEEAEAAKVDGFVSEEEWKRGVYSVEFPAHALSAPYSLAHGSAVKRTKTGETFVVKRLERPGLDGDCSVVVLLAKPAKG